MKNSLTPHVILAGSGSGDVGLITVKASEYLRNADYILTDRLVNLEILERYASPKAEIVYVGKHGGKESAKQEDINRLLVEFGQKNGLTVRLKGGDVAFFSNVVSEIEALQAHNISFELVPGITAASGASAYINMPLTARGLSRGVRFLTYQSDEHFDSSEWLNLAETNDTLVFYMSGRTLPELVRHLKVFAKTDKGIVVIEQATTPQQRVLTASLFSFDEKLSKTEIRQPALVVIGEVTKLYTRQSQANQNTIPFFKEH